MWVLWLDEDEFLIENKVSLGSCMRDRVMLDDKLESLKLIRAIKLTAQLSNSANLVELQGEIDGNAAAVRLPANKVAACVVIRKATWEEVDTLHAFGVRMRDVTNSEWLIALKPCIINGGEVELSELGTNAAIEPIWNDLAIPINKARLEQLLATDEEVKDLETLTFEAFHEKYRAQREYFIDHVVLTADDKPDRKFEIYRTYCNKRNGHTQVVVWEGDRKIIDWGLISWASGGGAHLDTAETCFQELWKEHIAPMFKLAAPGPEE